MLSPQTDDPDWGEVLEAERLRLEPLTVHHAAEMVPVLADARLYEFTGGAPPTLEQLQCRYAAQAVGRSADGRHWWLNWIVKLHASDQAVGFVQATVERDGSALTADLAWVIAPAHQHRRFASEAAGAMMQRLRRAGVTRFVAHIRFGHVASERVARHLGLHRTEIIEDGEARWQS